MKFTSALLIVTTSIASSLAYAQTDSMKGMDMKGMENKPCMEMMDKMDKKGMDSKKCADMMKNMDPKTTGTAAKKTTYEAVAVVKKVDGASGKVTLAHEPVKSLNWPAMTMAFAVKDKALLEKLAVGNTVHVEFNKQDSDYVITKVK